MKEDFLHYVWRYQKFDISELKTIHNEPLLIRNPGSLNKHAGPDFFNGLVCINGQEWAGNIEIHVKSSHWFAHGHHTDITYDSVILHVVWEHDRPVFRKNNNEIPTLQLKHAVNAAALSGYKKLFTKQQHWIACANDFGNIDDFRYRNWLDRLFIERLESKTRHIRNELIQSSNDWEAVFFKLVCRCFGGKVNGDSFYSIAASIHFSLLRKYYHDKQLLEALLMGQAGLLDQPAHGAYYNQLREKYAFIKLKFGLNNGHVVPPRFFRLRPYSFPTIRLAQIADLYSRHHSLFSELIASKELPDYYSILNCVADNYWKTHYRFGVSSQKKVKRLSKPAMNLLILNTILPMRFCYSSVHRSVTDESHLELAASIPAESNSVVTRFAQLRTKASSALETQALLQLKKQYCDKKRCLHCSMGHALLEGDIT